MNYQQTPAQNASNRTTYKQFLVREISRETETDANIMLFHVMAIGRGATPAEILRNVLLLQDDE